MFKIILLFLKMMILSKWFYQYIIYGQHINISDDEGIKLNEEEFKLKMCHMLHILINLALTSGGMFAKSMNIATNMKNWFTKKVTNYTYCEKNLAGDAKGSKKLSIMDPKEVRFFWWKRKYEDEIINKSNSSTKDTVKNSIETDIASARSSLNAGSLNLGDWEPVLDKDTGRYDKVKEELNKLLEIPIEDEEPNQEEQETKLEEEMKVLQKKIKSNKRRNFFWFDQDEYDQIEEELRTAKATYEEKRKVRRGEVFYILVERILNNIDITTSVLKLDEKAGKFKTSCFFKCEKKEQEEEKADEEFEPLKLKF